MVERATVFRDGRARYRKHLATHNNVRVLAPLEFVLIPISLKFYRAKRLTLRAIFIQWTSGCHGHLVRLHFTYAASCWHNGMVLNCGIYWLVNVCNILLLRSIRLFKIAPTRRKR